jgi:hypothetical protein
LHRKPPYRRQRSLRCGREFGMRDLLIGSIGASGSWLSPT